MEAPMKDWKKTEFKISKIEEESKVEVLSSTEVF